jgi:hypothetical protein
MSGRHQPTEGADSFDDSGPADHDCSYCGRTIYVGLLRPVTIGGSTSHLCQTCFDRQQARWAADEAAETAWKESVPESATFPEWMTWTGMKR